MYIKLDELFKEVDQREKVRVQTEAQVLAGQLCEFYQEPDRFGFWMGIITKFGREYVEYRWKQMVDSIDPKSPRLLIFEIKKYAKNRTGKHNKS